MSYFGPNYLKGTFSAQFSPTIWNVNNDIVFNKDKHLNVECLLLFFQFFLNVGDVTNSDFIVVIDTD